MGRLLKLVKRKERNQVKAAFGVYKRNTEREGLGTQGLETRTRKGRLRRVFQAWKSGVDREFCRRTLVRKCFKRLRKGLLREGMARWIKIIKEIVKDDGTQTELEHLDEWTQSEETKRIKTEIFSSSLAISIKISQKLDGQIKRIFVNSIERQQRDICFDYFMRWKINSNKLKSWQNSIHRLYSIIKQREMRKAIQIWSSNIQ